MSETKFATEVLELPSQGHFYPADNPLSKGVIDIRYMGAKEEDILTSTNLVKRGVAIDMVLKSVIVSPINYDDLLIGDKNALMVATRILGYGKDYQVQLTCPVCEQKHQEVIDLAALEHKKVDFASLPKGINEFAFELPVSKTPITFKFLTSMDESEVDAEIKAMKKVNDRYSTDLSTRLKKIITSVNGKRDTASIVKFVDSELVAGDSLALRKHLAKVQPGIDMSFDFKCKNPDCGYEERATMPLTVEFFWPGGSR
jgi:hypothetical protein